MENHLDSSSRGELSKHFSHLTCCAISNLDEEDFREMHFAYPTQGGSRFLTHAESFA